MISWVLLDHPYKNVAYVLLFLKDPLYSQYERLHCELTPVDVNSEEFEMVYCTCFVDFFVVSRL